MEKQIHPELGGKATGQIYAEFLYTHFIIKTELELKGRGLKYQYKRGKVNTYYGTQLAYKTLCQKYEVVKSIYLD